MPFYRRNSVLDCVSALSLDVAVGGLCSGIMFAEISGVSMPAVWYWLLPSSIWLVYTADHLFDSLKVKANALSFRHSFHHLHFRSISLGAGGIVVLNAFLAFYFLDAALVKFGIALGCISLLYLLWVQRMFNRKGKVFFKEFAVSGVYSLGIAGPPVVLASGFSPLAVPVFVVFFLLALGNLFSFSNFDCQLDRENGFPSIASSLNESNIKRLIFLVLFLAFLVAIFVLFAGHFSPFSFKVFAVLCFMNLGLIFLNLHRDVQYPCFRLVGDGLFLLPVFTVVL